MKSSLEISPCTKILVSPDAKISVSDSGSIKSIGTKECPVVFTSSKSSKAKGDWALIEIYEKSSSDNTFEHTILEYGGKGDYGVLWIDGGATVRIDNTTFDNSTSYGVYFDKDANIGSFTGNKFTNIDLNPIFVSANEVGSFSKIETKDNPKNNILVNGGEVTKTAVWKNNGVPYFIKQNVYIKAGVEIEAGTTLLMGEKTKISVSDGGSIKTFGTNEKPVTITSSKPSKGKGDWISVEIYSTASSDISFDYTVLEYGGDNGYGLLWIDEGAKVSITNTTFQQSSSYGLYLDEGAELKTFMGNKFTNISLNPISLTAAEIVMLNKIVTADNSANTILVRGGSNEKDGKWKNTGIPYEVKQYIYIKANIEVEEGTTILMSPDTKLLVSDKGSLRLKGTQSSNITIKSAKTSPAAGDWFEIDIYSSANNNNTWDFVNVMHGGGDDYGQVWIDKGITLTLNNCKFSDGKNCDIYIENGGNVVNNNSAYKVCSK
ncbi:MAG: hypothetical protein N3B13_03935 [Deltaproteobacteria bacterium]|nr:hypothetical protein [Deltaproteobacteria bacterium]